MSRVAIISVDGHVKAPRTAYRDYLEQEYLDDFDRWVRAAEESGLPDAGNLKPGFVADVQWDLDLRIKDLESIGVVAEVLFPNGRPFQLDPRDEASRATDTELAEAGRRAYNRWLTDFAAEAPERLRAQMQMSFVDVDETVKDVYWAKEHGLGGIALPGLTADSVAYFDPQLDPVWAAVQEVGLPISQHGGVALPAYGAQGFAATMTGLIENTYFSIRSLLMLIAGGVFDRFPDLRAAWIETEVRLMIPAIAYLNANLDPRGDWMAFARTINREKTTERLPSDYFGTNVFVGVSPFSPIQVPIDHLVGKDATGQPLGGFHIGADAAMFGVDYPQSESIFLRSMGEVAALVTTPAVTDADAHKILLENAAAVYDFDLLALQSHIDRVGFELADVRANAQELMRDMPTAELAGIAHAIARS